MSDISVAIEIVMVIGVTDKCSSILIEIQLEIIDQVPVRRLAADGEAIERDVRGVIYMIARLDDSEFRCRGRGVGGLREINVPARVIVVSCIVGGIPTNADRSGHSAGLHPGQQIYLCVWISRIVDRDWVAPSHALILRVDQENILPIGITSVNSAGSVEIA